MEIPRPAGPPIDRAVLQRARREHHARAARNRARRRWLARLAVATPYTDN